MQSPRQESSENLKSESATSDFQARLSARCAHQGLYIVLAGHLFVLSLCSLQPVCSLNPLRISRAGRLHEGFDGLDALLQALRLHALLAGQALQVPSGGQDVLAFEEIADLRRVGRVSLRSFAVGHAIQDCLQGWASIFDGAVVDIGLGCLLLSLDEVVNTVDEHRKVLFLGSQEGTIEDLSGTLEDATQKEIHESLRDSVAQAAGIDSPAGQLDVLDLLQASCLDEVLDGSLGLTHPAHHFGDEEGDVVVDSRAADVAGGRAEACIATQDESNKGRVEVGDVGESVEGALGQSCLGASSCGRWGLACDTGDQVHEQLGQFLVVQWVEHREGADGGAVGQLIGGVVASAWQDTVHGEVDRFRHGDASAQGGGDAGDVARAGLSEVGAHLEVPRIRCGLAVHQAEVGRAHDVVGGAVCGSSLQALLHGLGELVELHGVLCEPLGLAACQGLEVGHEVAVAGHVFLATSVGTPLDGVVGALEETKLAVLGHLQGGMEHLLGIGVGQGGARDDDRGANVVLGLDLRGRHEVVAQLELAGASSHRLLLLADAQVLHRDALAIHVGNIAIAAIHRHHADVGLPILAPLLLVDPLDQEDEASDHWGDGGQPVVVLVVVLIGRGQELHDRAVSALRAQQGELLMGAGLGGLVAIGVVSLQDHVDVGEIALDVVDSDGAEGDHVA
mmetsp:Transcript_80621/g.168064  ORF Transcript_80621/g.168064 Transcript_80621/m.168064 type:complete len:677 (+) Transcript_80621:213-2243(+)